MNRHTTVTAANSGSKGLWAQPTQSVFELSDEGKVGVIVAVFKGAIRALLKDSAIPIFEALAYACVGSRHAWRLAARCKLTRSGIQSSLTAAEMQNGKLNRYGTCVA
jgi:hypothetical protein